MIQSWRVIIALVAVKVSSVVALDIDDNWCTDAGVAPHPQNCTQFLVCASFRNGDAFVTQVINCPDHTAFSPEEATCIPAERVPGCAGTSPHIRDKRASEATSSCKQTGPYCESCDRMVVCVLKSNNILVPLSNMSCSDLNPALTCHTTSKGCSSVPNANCPITSNEFVCLMPGFFPDPNDCKSYHYCTDTLEPIQAFCDGEYNATTESCKGWPGTYDNPADGDPSGKNSGALTPGNPSLITSTSTTTPSSVLSEANKAKNSETPSCTQPISQTCSDSSLPEPFPAYPSFYRLCLPKVVRPGQQPLQYQTAVLKCPNNNIYNKETGSCDFSCNKLRGRYPDPDDCHNYYECDDQGKHLKKTCRIGFAYDRTRHLCVPESAVPTCRLTTSVTPPSQSTTSNAVTTTSPLNTITSISTTKAVTTPEPSGFRCTREGQFPDKDDCRRYIDCRLITGKLQPTSMFCPWLTRFNSYTGYCQFGLFC